MRALMQESLFLLFGTQVESAIMGNEQQGAPLLSLSYEDFEALRPNFGSSSWRVTMSRLLTKKMVFRGFERGKTVFQLTKLGKQKVQELFRSAGQVTQNPIWTLALFQGISGKRGSISVAKRLLAESGFQMINSSTALSFRSEYSGELYISLEKSGYLATFIPVKQQDVHPLSLLDFLPRTTMQNAQARKLRQISTSARDLLMDCKDSKRITHQQKQRLGSIAVSGLQLLSVWLPQEQESIQGFAERKEFAEIVDALFREYARIQK